MHRLERLLLTSVTSLVACASGGGGPAGGMPDQDRAGTPTTTAPGASAAGATASAGVDEATIEGSFGVGDHSLYMRCDGSGSPTVVYLHGYIHSSVEGGGSNAGAIPGLLLDDYRVCVYDRANVGQSDSVEGRQTGANSVRDLHALLRAADVPGPYVLLAASFGGLIAYQYAALHPEDVAGIVMLDANLPGDVAVDERFGGDPPSSDWRGTLEHLDVAATYREALELPEPPADIVVTYIASTDVPPSPEYIKGLRDMQNEFVGRFRDGTFIAAAAPHYMEPAIPEQIAEEVRNVAELVA